MSEEFNKRYLQFSEAFITSIKEIYSTMLSGEAAPGKPSIKSNQKAEGDYSAIMGMNGFYESDGGKAKFTGSFSLSWKDESYFKVAAAMLGEEEYTEMTDEISDVGMEICNIAMGGAKKILADSGYNIEMSTPSSVRGHDHIVGNRPDTITIMVPFESPLGTFTFEICYKEDE